MTSSSQAGQDVFAWEMLEHKTDGYFLDLGCNHPSFHSNTYGLELSGWTGLLADVLPGCELRKGAFVQCDASKPDEKLLFYYNQMPYVVDFASIDVDENLLPVLRAIPFEKHVFRVICLEHDCYVRGDNPRRESREFLSELGYHLVCADVKVVPPGMDSAQPFEDWWCFSPLVNPEMIKKFQCDGKLWSEIVK